MRKLAVVGLGLLLGMAAYAFDFEFSGYEGLTVSITFDIAEGEFNAQGWDDRAEFGFHAESWWGGQFSGHLWAGDAGHGMIDSGVQAVSAGPAWFSFWGTQDLFGYTDNRVWAMAYSGASEEAYMNLLFNNSMYVVGLGQADHHGPFLAAAGDEYGIGYAMQIQDPTGDASAGVTANIYGSGMGLLDTSHWFPATVGSYGWGDPDSISSPTWSSYYMPYNIAYAEGWGEFRVEIFGDHYLRFNGIEFPGGGALWMESEFYDGLEAEWRAGAE